MYWWLMSCPKPGQSTNHLMRFFLVPLWLIVFFNNLIIWQAIKGSCFISLLIIISKWPIQVKQTIE